jgi:hypothetical protein
VTGNGLEIISPPLKANNSSFKQITKICKILREKGMNVDRTCGLHIHLSRTGGFTAGQTATVYRRYEHFEEQIDEFMSRSRRQSVNQYCRALSGRLFTKTNIGRHFNFETIRDSVPRHQSDHYHRQEATNALMRLTHYDRYYKVNLQSLSQYGTIEFRQHSGTIDKHKIINWAKFLIEFCQKTIEILESETPEESFVQTQIQAFPTQNFVRRMFAAQYNLLNPKQKAILKLLYENRTGLTIREIRAKIIQQEPGTRISDGTIRSYLSILKTKITREQWEQNFRLVHENRKYRLTYENTRTNSRTANINVPWPTFTNDDLFNGINTKTAEFLKQRKLTLAVGTDSESTEPTQPTRRAIRQATQNY